MPARQQSSRLAAAQGLYFIKHTSPCIQAASYRDVVSCNLRFIKVNLKVTTYKQNLQVKSAFYKRFHFIKLITLRNTCRTTCGSSKNSKGLSSSVKEIQLPMKLAEITLTC
ncbi:hypothetical protein C0J52_23192 [Blattella germanica]|nr:hypothetical protein C0J52_23192 [Blattella germanica]